MKVKGILGCQNGTMNWIALATGLLGAAIGGAASAYGGYISTQRQQRHSSVAAAKLIVAELLRNQLRLEEFEKAPLGTRRLLMRSFQAERVAWHEHSSALTRFISNEAFAATASAYVQTELAEIIGAGKENRAQSLHAIKGAVGLLTDYVAGFEQRPVAILMPGLSWGGVDESATEGQDERADGPPTS